MTLLAVRLESRRHVIRVRRSGIRLGVTPHAVHRRSAVFLPGVTAVTRLAIGHSMDAGQRETLLCMLFQHILAVLPVTRRMTVLTGHTKLSLVVVGVAIGTGNSHMVEHRVLVAADTLRRRMSAGQVESGFVVV